MKLYFEMNELVRLSLINGETVEGRVAAVDEENSMVIIRPQIPCRNYSAMLETFDADLEATIYVNLDYIVYYRKLTSKEIRTKYQLRTTNVDVDGI